MPRYNTGLYIYNGNSEPGMLEQNLSATIPILSQEVQQLSIIQTLSLEEFQNACREEAPQVEVLFILGGDGTLHECINILAEVENPPVIGILPGGTCNDFSRVLDIPQNMQQAARAIIQGEERKVDAGKADEGYFLNFWGIGLVTQTSFNIDEGQKDRFGVLSYFISALKTINQAAPFNFSIQVDEDTIKGEAVMILVLNGQFIGTRQLPVPTIHLQDGKLDVLIIKNSNLTSFRELLTMGQPGAEQRRFQELSHMQGEQIKVSTEPEQDVDMDGEIHGKTDSTIEVLPDHFTFLTGGDNALRLNNRAE
ncbi:YegS/Rv2252/BmrU family lipid kinase [Halobacillus salinarum]|uniref:YegS/Rv2252/BmrU family lipid kinase n=1 Tax=Halobacillus salinarum TaxID=2932257 RepID=A0ABY4EIW2_9BACI|nr:YegS/Rv2252/BmrU family lipid kinase [Halobacillus salinarum]UOQ44370.1 YegS/Rv2252/BmrU family lipid kinase [Halobacillus salinarum]